MKSKVSKKERPALQIRREMQTTAGIEVRELYRREHTRIVSGVCSVQGTVVYVNVRDARLSLNDKDFNRIVALSVNQSEFENFKELWDAVVASHGHIGDRCHCDVLFHVGYTFAGAPIMSNSSRVWSTPNRKAGVGSLWSDYRKQLSERPPFAMYPMIEFSFF